jgi:queuine/archaeosine tRNA-ribosyltransferase
MKFDLLKKDPQSKARAGSITTDHGVIETNFYACGYCSFSKRVHQRELKEDINQILFGKHLSFIFTPTNGDPGESRWFA